MSTNNAQKERLLIVGDIEQAASSINIDRFAILHVPDVRAAMRLIGAYPLSLILIVMDDRIGFEAIDVLFGLPHRPPVAILDTQQDVERLLTALRIGVANYLFTSDRSEENTAALEETIRRSKEAHPRYQYGGQGSPVVLQDNVLMVGADAMLFSQKEAAIMRVLLDHPNQLVDYATLASAIFPQAVDPQQAPALLRPYILRLRRKFNQATNLRWSITTVRGKGYALRI